jgi:hypothetical protein
MLLSRARSSRRPLLVTLVLTGLAGATALGGGCTTSTSPATSEGDGGGEGDSSSPGLDATADGSTSPDGATDSGPASSVDGSTCPNAPTHLPAGFTQVVVSSGVEAMLTGAASYRPQAMVLDENDDPMFAYSSADSSTSWSIHFTRWDACAGQFTAPLTVTTLHPGAEADVAIAYDPSTKEIGIAYVATATDNNWADGFSEIWLATMKAPATSFTVQQITTGSTDDNSAAAPSIAMAKGQIYLSFWDGPYAFSYPGLVIFLSSTTTPSYPSTYAPSPIEDGGTGDAMVPINEDAGEDAGAAPPHFFAGEAIPFTGGYHGYLNPTQGPASVSLAIDSTGAPAIAAYGLDSTAYGKQVMYWRPGMAQAVAVYSFAVDGEVDLALAFEGTKPRIAGHMTTPTEVDASTPEPDSLMFFESDDGTTWSPGVNLPSNDGAQSTAFTSALALDGMGNAAVVSHTNTSGGSACGADPWVATSSDEGDGGAVWTACGVDTSDVHQYGSYSVSAAYGASRLKGTLAVSFVADTSDVTDAGADQVGILYWQHP